MRTLIISSRQAASLNEEELNTVKFRSMDDFNPEVINKADRQFGDYNIEIGNENDEDSNITLDLNSHTGDPTSSIEQTATQQLSNQPNEDEITLLGTVRNGKMTEGVVFSKKKLEEARIANLKKNGTTYSKKDLEKTFFN